MFITYVLGCSSPLLRKRTVPVTAYVLVFNRSPRPHIIGATQHDNDVDAETIRCSMNTNGKLSIRNRPTRH